MTFDERSAQSSLASVGTARLTKAGQHLKSGGRQARTFEDPEQPHKFCEPGTQ